MSFNYTASRNGNEKEIFYRGSKLLGTEFHAPKDMLNIHEEYEKLLRNRNFDEARNLEKEKNAPKYG